MVRTRFDPNIAATEALGDARQWLDSQREKSACDRVSEAVQRQAVEIFKEKLDERFGSKNAADLHYLKMTASQQVRNLVRSMESSSSGS